MKKLSRVFLVLLSASLFLVSCNSDDDSPSVSLGSYENGLFVLNEGNSNASSATLTFIGNDGTVEHDVYKNVNPNAPALGSYLQYVFFDNTRAFIISGLANRITVVNRYTMEYIATVDTNLSNPRYGAVVNGKAYVTNYANYEIGSDDFLTVIDLNDYSTSQIALHNWSEKIIAENGKLYIANGYYGDGTSITVFNPNTNTSEAVIELGFSPNSLEAENGNLYVLGEEKLSKINLSDNQIAGTPIEVSNAASTGARNLNVENNRIYYTIGPSVYMMNLTATTAPTAPLFSYTSNSVFGAMYGFAVNGNKIYIADGGDFSSDSKAYIYSEAGSLMNEITVGVGPNGFYFN